jgi:hypothetical protein
MDSLKLILRLAIYKKIDFALFELIRSVKNIFIYFSRSQRCGQKMKGIRGIYVFTC